MSTPQNVDLAILGAGCAGLSLARELAKHQVTQSVLVIEPRLTYPDDRSWCFWAPDTHTGSAWVSHSWPRWLFGRQGATTRSQSCPGYRYQYIRSSDFYQGSLATIQAWPSIDLKLGESVVDLRPLEQGWQVTTTAGTYLAKQVVDTRPPPKQRRDQSPLQQCFLGAEIQLTHARCTDTKAAELMTDMRTVNGEFCFSYVLPFAPNRLLVEVTFFARTPPPRASLESLLMQLIADRGWADATILRTEFAELPMGLPDEPASDQKQPLLAGLRGGALRPSSGYGFLRIQHWASHCAQRYNTDSTLVNQTTSGFWLQKMDQLFLSVLQTNPARAAEIFDRLLGNTKPERFIRFMNDEASLSDCLHVVACLPKTPFLKALVGSLPALVTRQT